MAGTSLKNHKESEIQVSKSVLCFLPFVHQDTSFSPLFFLYFYFYSSLALCSQQTIHTPSVTGTVTKEEYAQPLTRHLVLLLSGIHHPGSDFYVLSCLGDRVCTHHGPRVEVKGQRVGVDSFPMWVPGIELRLGSKSLYLPSQHFCFEFAPVAQAVLICPCHLLLHVDTKELKSGCPTKACGRIHSSIANESQGKQGSTSCILLMQLFLQSTSEYIYWVLMEIQMQDM